MHDTYGKEETAKALPQIIKYFKDNGYDIIDYSINRLLYIKVKKVKTNFSKQILRRNNI